MLTGGTDPFFRDCCNPNVNITVTVKLQTSRLSSSNSNWIEKVKNLLKEAYFNTVITPSCYFWRLKIRRQYGRRFTDRLSGHRRWHRYVLNFTKNTGAMAIAAHLSILFFSTAWASMFCICSTSSNVIIP